MHKFRFIGVLLAFGLAGLVSYVGNIDFFKVISLLGFILVVDSLIVRYLSNLYLKFIYQQMEEEHFSKDKNETENK